MLEAELRNRLRARARQLGDKRDARSGEHQLDHLVVDCAYEHWYRMLFARFLAENNVLMHPDGVAVTPEEYEELAPDEGAEDGWELAARYVVGDVGKKGDRINDHRLTLAEKQAARDKSTAHAGEVG